VLRDVQVNRYPDPACAELKEDLKLLMGVDPRHQVVLGNGSDEIILMLAQALGGPDRCFMSPEPSFVMYRLIAAMNGLAYEGVPLEATDFSLHASTAIRAIEDRQPAVVFVANPNNPTGNIHDLDTLGQLAEVCPGILVIDEAYAPFTDVTAAELVEEYSNVLIMRTVSKMGLAGLRLGYLFGDEGWIGELEKVRLPYNINVLTQISARFALDNKPVFDRQAEQICSSRSRLYSSLSRVAGLSVWPSEANFILFRVEQGTSGRVFEALKQQNILIKSLDGSHPLLRNCLRVTVGSEEENRRFVAAMADIMAEDAG